MTSISRVREQEFPQVILAEETKSPQCESSSRFLTEPEINILFGNLFPAQNSTKSGFSLSVSIHKSLASQPTCSPLTVLIVGAMLSLKSENCYLSLRKTMTGDINDQQLLSNEGTFTWDLMCVPYQ